MFALKTWEGEKLAEMKVSQLMNNEVVTSNPHEPLSKVIGKMSNGSLHEIPIVDSKNRLKGYFGFDILAKKKHVPLYTKVETVMVAPPKIEENKSLFEASNVMLETGFRAVPVVDKDDRLKGIISRTDIIRVVPKMDELGDATADEIMTAEPKVLQKHDDVEKALALMVELNEFCAPVVDENKKVSGGVRIDDMSRSVWYMEEGVPIGDVVGENNKPNIEVSAFISPVTVVREKTKLRELCAEMSKVNPYLCVVVDGSDRPVGVITQYDILKKLIRYTPERGVYVDITGLDINDSFVYSSLVSKIERFVEKIGEFSWINPDNLNLHIVDYEREGGRRKWSVRARFSTDKGLFYVKSHGWNLLGCIDEIVEELTRKITRLKKR